MPGRIWSKEEREYLESTWGYQNPVAIARKLGRSLRGVQAMAYKRMRLGPVSRASGRISARELHRVIRGPKTNNTYPERTFARMGLRSSLVRNCKKKEYMIQLDDFWHWARGHMDYIRLDVFTPGTLGAEPEWMREERSRRRDIKAKWQSWTEQETKRLIAETEAGMTLEEIGRAHGRTPRSVESRLKYIGKLRAVTRPPRIWTAQEKMRAAGLARAWYDTEEIARILGRSRESTRLLLSRIMTRPEYGE